MYRGHVYVPKDPQLCHDIVHAHHDSVMTSHPGQWKTLELVSHNYWWPGISHYVASYVAGCDVCNHCKSFLMQKVGKLTPNRIPTRRWEVISVDTIGELLESKGYNTILVVVDSVTTSSPGDRVGPEAGRLGRSHWAGPSVTRSAKVSQRFYGGVMIVILAKGK